MSRTYHDQNKDRAMKQEPKWWRKIKKHQRRRMSVKEAINKIKKGDDEVLFPLDKKPWIYYW